MRAVPRLCGFYPGICPTTEENAQKNLIQCSRRVPAGTMKIHKHTIRKFRNIGEQKLNNTESKPRRHTCITYCYVAPVPSTLTIYFEYLIPSVKFSWSIEKYRNYFSVHYYILSSLPALCLPYRCVRWREQVIHVCGRHKPWYVENRVLVRNI